MDTFINNALTEAIIKYISYKNNNTPNDFLINVIITLSNIYGETDIINPFNLKDSKSFQTNMLKYGLDDIKLNKFYSDLDKYYEISKQQVQYNPFINFILEDLIDMFIIKYNNMNLTSNEIDNFKLLINTLFKNDYATKYLNSEIYKINNPLNFKLIKKNLLRKDVYEAFGLTNEKVDKLTQEDVDNINAQILAYYRLSPIEPNLNDKIIEAVNNKPDKLSLKLAQNPDIVTILLLVTSFSCFIISGVLVALKFMGRM